MTAYAKILLSEGKRARGPGATGKAGKCSLPGNAFSIPRSSEKCNKKRHTYVKFTKHIAPKDEAAWPAFAGNGLKHCADRKLKSRTDRKLKIMLDISKFSCIIIYAFWV